MKTIIGKKLDDASDPGLDITGVSTETGKNAEVTITVKKEQFKKVFAALKEAGVVCSPSMPF